ncbi:MAG TPA: hypothetical protein VK689_07870 [Armatimonadota bacterium]|nr:hypothetical protein [Armatimonadota bacterium]
MRPRTEAAVSDLERAVELYMRAEPFSVLAQRWVRQARWMLRSMVKRHRQR